MRRNWQEDENHKMTMLYHILIDRFADCNPARKGRGYKGGTLGGIIRKLDYIQNLGATGLLLTPFQKGWAYHGYHITDYEKVNPHFGSWRTVDRLVGEAHRRGMTVTADFVANHCHRRCALFTQHPDWFRRDRNGLFTSFNGIDYLPEFDLDHPEARHYMTEQGLNLCRHGFDALRLDYAKGPSLSFWRYFRQRLKAEFPHIRLIGEVWGRPVDKRLPAALSQAYHEGRMTEKEVWQKRYAEVFDGVLDFAYQELLLQTVRAGKGIAGNEELHTATRRHFAHYADCPDFELYLFLDNHDTNRFLFECKNDVRLLREAIAFSQSWNRPYIMYYGTEKGMTHTESIENGKPYADEQVRQCFNLEIPSVIAPESCQ